MGARKAFTRRFAVALFLYRTAIPGRVDATNASVIVDTAGLHCYDTAVPRDPFSTLQKLRTR